MTQIIRAGAIEGMSQGWLCSCPDGHMVTYYVMLLVSIPSPPRSASGISTLACLLHCLLPDDSNPVGDRCLYAADTPGRVGHGQASLSSIWGSTRPLLFSVLFFPPKADPVLACRWSRDLYELLRPAFPGQLPRLGRNLLNALFLINPGTLTGCRYTVLHMHHAPSHLCSAWLWILSVSMRIHL